MTVVGNVGAAANAIGQAVSISPFSGKGSPLSQVVFASDEISTRSTARMAGPAQLTQNQPAGWQQTQRFGRLSFTLYQEGGAGFQLDIPFIFDGYTDGTVVESDINALERLGEIIPAQERTPICTVDANGGIPHDLTRSPKLRWVIVNIVWGDFIMNQQNQRTRQVGTVTLWQWIPDKIIATKNLPLGTAIPNNYKIQSGDTLQKIAAHYYGDQAQWHSIVSANPKKLRDPNHPPVGTVIKLPKITLK